MSLVHTIILGIVEGITEFLPVSSTGHLILVEKILLIPQTEFVKSFDIIIQLGAILAVVILYAKTVLTKLFLIPKIIVAFLPTAVIGFSLYSVVKHSLLGNPLVTVVSLFAGGVLFILLERKLGKDTVSTSSLSGITLAQSFFIGLMQSVSIVPGVSRAAASIFGGMMTGLTRQTAVEFSFLLAIPTMAAAVGLDLIKTGFLFSRSEWTTLGIGFMISFLTALIAVKFLMAFIKTNTFVPFGVYRIVLAIAFWALILRP